MAEKNTESKKKLVDFGKGLVKQAEKGENPAMDVPIRTLSNVNYSQKTGMLSLGIKSSKRFFFNVAHVRKFVQTAEVAALAKELLTVDKSLSLRQAFYAIRRTIAGTNIDIVDDQVESNKALEDLELITDISREQLHINANKLGSIAGNVIIKDKGIGGKEILIDWSKQGSGGWSIPSRVEHLEFKKVDAKFVIYMEKAAMWERLNEDEIWDKLNCIIISSQGQATRGIRRLLQRLNTEEKLPIYILTDFDPWGFYIYSVIKTGSISLAHASERLAVPSARFLGLTADDIEKYALKKHIIRFKDVDLKRIDEISKYAWFKDKKEWQKQFELMKQMKGKVELDALVSRGISFVSEKYLPEKLKAKDFLD
ncbi:MAG: DNA topoisomerase IV subunit A [Candidatus Aenigmarchaeota archaeon]|nr:DNA topoisomerase IV subunit A [Candidatus Aenigmarchaeota archaeon]